MLQSLRFDSANVPPRPVAPVHDYWIARRCKEGDGLQEWPSRTRSFGAAYDDEDLVNRRPRSTQTLCFVGCFLQLFTILCDGLTHSPLRVFIVSLDKVSERSGEVGNV
jgi:hypothetical protein